MKVEPSRPEFADELSARIQAAAATLEQILDSDAPVADQAAAVGTFTVSIAAVVSDFGEGVGEFLESAIAEGLGSKEFGSSFLAEIVEAGMAVTGEFAELTIEMAGSIGGSLASAVGGAVEAASKTVGSVIDAALHLHDGDVGSAVEELWTAIRIVGDFSVESLIDIAALQLLIIGELLEGGIEIGAELAEGLAEVGTGALDDFVYLIEQALKIDDAAPESVDDGVSAQPEPAEPTTDAVIDVIGGGNEVDQVSGQVGHTVDHDDDGIADATYPTSELSSYDAPTASYDTTSQDDLLADDQTNHDTTSQDDLLADDQTNHDTTSQDDLLADDQTNHDTTSQDDLLADEISSEIELNDFDDQDTEFEDHHDDAMADAGAH